MTIGTLAIMGCGADSVQYPGAPTISIKKTGWTSEDVEEHIVDAAGIRARGVYRTTWLLKCRLEAEEPLPYDIEVPIELGSVDISS